MKNGVMEEVKRVFKPEFINRIDDIIVFHQLVKEDMKDIMTLLSKDLISRCATLCDIFITNDRKFADKYKAVAFYLAIPIKILVWEDIKDSI